MDTSIYDRIKQLCEDRGITIGALETKAGLGRGISQKWRKGSSPSAESLVKIADYFNVSVDYLVGRTDIATGITEFIKDDDLITLMRDKNFVSLKRAMVKVPKNKRKSIADLITVTFTDDDQN